MDTAHRLRGEDWLLNLDTYPGHRGQRVLDRAADCCMQAVREGGTLTTTYLFESLFAGRAADPRFDAVTSILAGAGSVCLVCPAGG